MCYWSEGSGVWMAVGMVLMFAFWAGIIGLGAWTVWRLTGHRTTGTEALASARERYARGEISRDEFERIKKDLS